MQRINYGRVLNETIKELSFSNLRPSLLLHSCCAPCSSSVLEYISPYFDITLFYYNPNISPENEYRFRVDEVRRLLAEMGINNKVGFVEGRYNPMAFYDMAKGMESLPEGGERCFACYRLRLKETAEYAKNNGFYYFTTTLSISPYKNSEKLNEIGGQLAEEYGLKYLFSDFKKNDGYKRSIVLSEQYNLYRQNYCGCIYSYDEMKKRQKEKSKCE